jgi:hypothetical protein
MSIHANTPGRHGLAVVLVVIGLATASAASAAPRKSAAPPRPAPVAGCVESPRSSEACAVVRRFFQHAERGRFAASCALLGEGLRQESGGTRCASAMAWAYFAGMRSWAVVGARSSELSVGVLVRLAMPELGRTRTLTWLASVANERGAPRIVSTRQVG